jgi:E3 ubiquitin-protein ligase CBL
MPQLQTVLEPSPSSSGNSDNLLLDDGIILGPAETISGIIDTRPLDQRHPIMPKNTDNKSAPPPLQPSSNNLYQLKTNSNYSINDSGQLPLVSKVGANDRHQRHQSVPAAGQSVAASVTPSKSSTTSQLAKPSVFCYENVTLKCNKIENLSLKDCTGSGSNNVPYENINLEYIARLMNEGYSKENVVTALGISRNNIEMACDILHEFVSKSGA